jgi:hypothetical protein
VTTDDFLSQDDTAPQVPPDLLPDRWVVKEDYCEIYWHDDGCGMGGEYVSVGSCGAAIQTALWHPDELLAIASDMRVQTGEPPVVLLTPKTLGAALDMIANDLGVGSQIEQNVATYLRYIADKIRHVGEVPKPKADQ